MKKSDRYNYVEGSRSTDHGSRIYDVAGEKLPSVTTILAKTKDQSYFSAMHRSHESIGYAMYYTSITIIIGFSILVLSKFIPSIYFGLLTGLAMLIALLAALTLLPQLLIVLMMVTKILWISILILEVPILQLSSKCLASINIIILI